MQASAPSSAWQMIMKRVHIAKSNAGKRTRDAMSVSGPEFYGFASDICSHLIEGLPGSVDCDGYVFRDQRLTKAGPKPMRIVKKRGRIEAGDDEDGVASDEGDDGTRKSAVRGAGGWVAPGDSVSGVDVVVSCGAWCLFYCYFVRVLCRVMPVPVLWCVVRVVLCVVGSGWVEGGGWRGKSGFNVVTACSCTLFS